MIVFCVQPQREWNYVHWNFAITAIAGRPAHAAKTRVGSFPGNSQDCFNGSTDILPGFCMWTQFGFERAWRDGFADAHQICSRVAVAGASWVMRENDIAEIFSFLALRALDPY